MRNLLVIVLCLSLFASSCSRRQVEDVDEVKSPSDALVDMLTTQKTGYLHSVLKGILKNGQIEKRIVKGVLVNREYEHVTEIWIVLDRGGNRHQVTIENGLLVNIDEYKTEETAAAPIGGWQQQQ